MKSRLTSALWLERHLLSKITSRTDPAKEILELEGQLLGPWVEELEGCWQHAVVAHQPVRVVLKAVTFIDDKGKKLLALNVRKRHRAGGPGMPDKSHCR